MLPNITLVLGGAASGKSSFAEALLETHCKSKTYIATAQAFDDEMRRKISQHKLSRGAEWPTIEEPLELAAALNDVSGDTGVLIDCATLWLSNLLLANRDPEPATNALISTLDDFGGPVVIVSNEVGQGIVPATKLGRQFREAQGRLNIRLAARSDLVVKVIAGLPLVLKGTLP